ncbi:uncharacterized protein [Fopius arisanus]|uniref:Condensin-2 complex subunit H2 C-terminal domain-containing protein n=1 Tax=Fopius arisanus TaxID=64838 RepID=A0A9R1T5I5_9HYME|nr:PREDICTED: uncharacterized protein LOC105266411 [Fopius arisanus]
MNLSTLSRAIAVLGKFLPPAEMDEFIRELMQLKTPKVEWNFPLSDALSAYSQMMNTVEGCTLNYSETALVIQNSAHVFEKRVENLYHDTCGLRKTLDEHEAEHEAAKAAKPRQRSHRKNLDLENVERFDFLKDSTKNCFLKSRRPQKKIKLLSQRYPQLENLCRHKFSLDVVDTHGEKIGKKYDFRCNQQLTSSLMLVDELSPEDLHRSSRISVESSPFHHDSIPSCSTPYPSSPGLLNSSLQEKSPPNILSFPQTSPPRTSSSPSPSQAHLDHLDTSDFDTNDFCDSQDAEALDQTQESGYCTFSDISTSENLSTIQPGGESMTLSHETSTKIHEKDKSPSNNDPPSSTTSPDSVGLETPPENSSPVPLTQTPEPPQEEISLLSKRNRDSMETDAGYTSGGPEDLPKSPVLIRRSKRLKKSAMEELNDKSYEAIPFQAPIPEKSSKTRKRFKLPCHPSLLRSDRPKKRKVLLLGNDEKMKKHLMSDAEERNKLVMYSPSRSLSDHYREEHEEFQKMVHQCYTQFNVSHFEAVLGENECLRGFALIGKGGILNGEKFLQKVGASGHEVKDTNLKLTVDVVDHRLQELQETSCSYTPPHSPAFSGGFELEDEPVENEDFVETEGATLTHQQKIERRMQELQKEFDVRHDREEETVRWFDMMETLKAAEKRPVFDVREYEEKIVRGLTDEPDNRLGFEELAWREKPEDIARLFVASLHLANTYTVDITASADQSNVHLNLLKRDGFHSS